MRGLSRQHKHILLEHHQLLILPGDCKLSEDKDLVFWCVYIKSVHNRVWMGKGDFFFI